MARGALSVLAPAGPAGRGPLRGGRSEAGAHLAGIGLAVKVSGAEHVGADVRPIYLGAAALVVGHQGHQRLLQGAGIAAPVCGHGAVSGARRPWPGPLPAPGRRAAPTRAHSRPGGPSPQSGTCVRWGRGCWARAGRWAGRTGNGLHSGPLSSSAGSALGQEEARGQHGACGSAMDRGRPLSYTRVQPHWAGPRNAGRPGPRLLGRGRSATPGTLPPCPGPPPSRPPPARLPARARGAQSVGSPPAAPRRVPCLTKVVVTGAEHRVQRVRDVLLDLKRLCHVRRAVEEVLAQDHRDALPGGACRGGAGGSPSPPSPLALVQTPLGSTRSRLRASVFPSAGCRVTLTPTGPSCPGLHLQATVALWPLGPPRPQALLENGLPHHGEPMPSTQQSLAAPLQGRARAGGPGVSPGSLPGGWPVSAGLETPTPRGARRGSLLLPFVWLRCRPLL